jgi:hypothetical protein
MGQDENSVDRKEAHQYKKAVKAIKAGSFEEQKTTDQQLGTRHEPDEEGRPEI